MTEKEFEDGWEFVKLEVHNMYFFFQFSMLMSTDFFMSDCN